MTISYGIALSMDWGTPMWAGFSVAFVSLSTSGQSFQKSTMRMLGTLIAGLASLILIALFPQDRWLFIFALSLYIGFCTYMMGAAKYQYFWFVCGYVCIIVALEAGPNPINAFHLATLRAQETGLGILVYSVVTALLWRKSSIDEFNTNITQLQSTLHQLYQSSFNLMIKKGDLTATKALMAQSAQLQTRFKMLLVAVQTESYDVRQHNLQWQLYQKQVTELSTIMERWHDDLASVKTIDQKQIMLNLEAFDNAIQQRFEQIKRMLKANAPEYQMQTIKLQLDKEALKSLSHFQVSALLAMQINLQQLEQVTQAIWHNIAEIKGFSQSTSPASKSQSEKTEFSFDIERLASIIQVMATLWLSFLTFIYIPDLPGGILFVVITGVIGMSLAANPNRPVSSMFVPFASSTLFCGIIYAIIMPQLSSFFGLGMVIFIATFLICYLYSSPQQGMGRAAGLAVFVTMIGVNNQQTYNVLSVFNTGLVFVEMFIILVITAHIPFSARPERALTRLLSRFFRSSGYLIASLSIEQQHPLSFWERKRKAFHLQELKTLPNKIKNRSQLLNPKQLQGVSIQQIQTIISQLQRVHIRLKILLEARTQPQDQLLASALQTDSQAWNQCMLEASQTLAKHSVIETQRDFQTQLMDITVDLESDIETLLNEMESEQLNERDEENFYRLLGAYHGASNALLDYSDHAQLINWAKWQETRF